MATLWSADSAIDTGRADGQASLRGLVPKRAPSQAAFDAQRGHLKADMVLPRGVFQMHAATEPLAQDGDAAFAWCTAHRQRCRQAAILPIHVEFTDRFHHRHS